MLIMFSRRQAIETSEHLCIVHLLVSVLLNLLIVQSRINEVTREKPQTFI